MEAIMEAVMEAGLYRTVLCCNHQDGVAVLVASIDSNACSQTTSDYYHIWTYAL